MMGPHLEYQRPSFKVNRARMPECQAKMQAFLGKLVGNILPDIPHIPVIDMDRGRCGFRRCRFRGNGVCRLRGLDRPLARVYGRFLPGLGRLLLRRRPGILHSYRLYYQLGRRM